MTWRVRSQLWSRNEKSGHQQSQGKLYDDGCITTASREVRIFSSMALKSKEKNVSLTHADMRSCS